MPPISKADRQAFTDRRAALAKARVPLLCLTASLIFLIVSSQYVVREALFGGDTFRRGEILIWATLVAGVAAILWGHSRAKGFAAYRGNAYAFTALFLACLTALALTYPENALVFPFYYAFTLLLVAVMMPWSMTDVAVLSSFTFAFYTFYYFFVRFGMRMDVEGLSRFHPYVDGMIFIGIGCVVAAVIRKKENERDLRNFLLAREVEEKNLRIEAELQMAAQVHRTLVPKSGEWPRADVAITYIPVGHIGGDYAAYRFVDDDRLVVFVSDVSGHGVPAALLANRVHSEFERVTGETAAPGEILNRLGRFLSGDFDESRMFMSAVCALVDFSKGTLTYASHGHPDQYVLRGGSTELVALPSTAGLLGGPVDSAAFENERMVTFAAGDSLLFFTDGVVEAMNARGEFFGESRLAESFASQSGVDAAAWNARLVDEIRAFTQTRFHDDVFIVHVRTKAAAASPRRAAHGAAPAA